MKRATILAMAFILFICTEALAVNCHCFTVRDYDPADPVSADPYILATASNSLLAGALGLEKSVVVKLRMGGAEEPDVWLGLTAAKISGMEAGVLFSAREKEGTWAKAYAAAGFEPSVFGRNFNAALPKDEAVAAEKIADLVLEASFPAQRAAIAPLRGEGATTGQTATALYYGRETGKDVLASFLAVKGGRASWGRFFHDAGITPKMISPAIIGLARPPAHPSD